MFGKLRDFETVAELRSSKILEEHAMKVICTIDDAIVNLDDMPYVSRMLQTVAQSHSSRFPNFNPDFFLVSARFSFLSARRRAADADSRARQLYKNITMLLLFPVKDGKLSTGVNATFDASCYG